MSRLVVLLLALVIASAPAAAEDDLDIAGRDSLELRGDALIWEDAQLHLEPWEGGASVRLVTFSRGREPEVGRAIPVKIVASAMREFVEIELVEAPACATRRVDPDHRLDALRVYIKRRDLAPVLVKPYVASHGDGTSVRLEPGVPVLPTSGGTYVVSARGDKLRLPIPHGSVGYIYPRGRVDEPGLPKGPVVRLDRNTRVELGGRSFDARGAWLAPRPAKAAESVLLRWSARCIELVVSAPSRTLRKAQAVDHLFATGRSPKPRLDHRVPPGAPLATPGGREVAVAGEEIDVSPPLGGKSCFDARLTLVRLEDRPAGQTVRTFRLCAPAALVEGPPAEAELEVAMMSTRAAPSDVGAPPPHARRTPLGVWYTVLHAGKGGRKPRATDTVVVHYSGWTTDGTLIDSSIKRGQPAKFRLDAVIAGWTDGLQLMAIGDRLRLWIPEELAYKGVRGAPAGMLVFDVELLGIE